MKHNASRLWCHCRSEAGLDDTKHFMVFHHYDDSVTLQLVGAVAKVLGTVSKHNVACMHASDDAHTDVLVWVADEYRPTIVTPVQT